MLVVRHETELEYSEPIFETVMEVRVTPPSDDRQVLRGHRIDVGPAATLVEYQDWLGNRTHQFSILTQHSKVVIYAQSAIEVTPRYDDFKDWPAAPPSVASQPAAGRAPELIDFCLPSALILDDSRLDDLARTLGLDERMATPEVVEKLIRNLTDEITYEKGVTNSATTIAHVLEKRGGVCQDLAHVAIGILRRRGIPARYVSGYFRTGDGKAELETHAWLEVHSPPIGWIGVDPTHHCVRGPGHIVVAVGRDYADVPPNRGVFRGTAKESIHVTVTIEEAEGAPEGLLAPRSESLDIRAQPAAVPVHSESLDYQQEQQQQQ